MVFPSALGKSPTASRPGWFSESRAGFISTLHCRPSAPQTTRWLHRAEAVWFRANGGWFRIFDGQSQESGTRDFSPQGQNSIPNGELDAVCREPLREAGAYIVRVALATATVTMGGPIRTFFVSLLGAAALATGLVILNQKGPEPLPKKRDSHAGERQPGTISLERLRKLGY
jgi:hypothetical protein